MLCEEIMKNRLLTIKEVRRHLNCATSTVYRWMADDYFPRPYRIGGMARWDEGDVENFLEGVKMRKTKFGMKVHGLRRPGRPNAYPGLRQPPKPEPTDKS